MHARTLATIAATAAAIALSPVASAVPAVAAPVSAPATDATAPPTSDFTAGIRSIDHWLGVVTVAGTGPAGGSIGITGDGVETAWTDAGPDGTWSVAVRVGRGERVVRVTSQVSGRVIDLPVELLNLTAPGMLGTVDGIARTITLEGTGYAGAHIVVHDDGTVVGETDVDADDQWSFTLRDRAFGEHHVEAFQYFDGTRNGGVDEVYTVSGAAVVTTATASRETERVTLAGRAPAGSTLRFADEDGPVLGPDGRPTTVTAGDDTRWTVELPIPTDARFATFTVTTFDGPTELATTEARVTIPVALSGTVEELPDGSVRLSGGGENGGVVSLESERGEPIVSADGDPVQTVIGRSWELVLPRTLFTGDVVVARQRVDGVEQGGLRLVLPEQPVRPAPDPGEETGPGSGDHVSVGTHPAAQQLAAGRITAASADRLAYTGDDPTAPIGAAVALLTAGLGGLVAAGALRRRAARRP
jgi:hypothetical protein